MSEFRKEAVRLVTGQGYRVPEAVRNLRIRPSVLQRWKGQLASEGPNAFPGKGQKEAFVNKVRDESGVRAIGRTLVTDGKQQQLRDAPQSYNSHFDPEKGRLK